MIKLLSKKNQFEIFKRDLFQCQRCGKKAPDVLLEINNINSNKTNNTVYFITMCQSCNKDKKTKVPEKGQERQFILTELRKRQEQIEMIIQWHETLLFEI